MIFFNMTYMYTSAIFQNLLMRSSIKDSIQLPRLASRGPTLEPSMGLRLVGKHLVAGDFVVISGVLDLTLGLTCKTRVRAVHLPLLGGEIDGGKGGQKYLADLNLL